MTGERETFGSRLGLLATMIGVAVGLGNVWRFPYMVGKFGGASFVLFYVAIVVLIGVPVLIAEWALGRATRRGPVGAYARAGLPGGRFLGWFFFAVMIAATGYYSNALGWVLFHAIGQLAHLLGLPFDAAVVLPPESGFDPRAFALQAAGVAAIAGACVAVLLKGLRGGIEVASKAIMPVLLLSLLVLIARVLTLPGAAEGVSWYILKFDAAALTPTVMVAALGQACFTLSIGGTFMVVYGSYLNEREALARNAVLTAFGDTAAGLLAGLAILPAVIALGLEPGAGPGLLFHTLPQVFDAIPGGSLFGLIFYLGLLGAAYLSAIAAFEVMVAGLTDNTRLERRQATFLLAGIVLLAAMPSMTNLRVFTIWDLTFGSGMQTFGALCAVLTLGWCVERAAVLEQLSDVDLPWRRWLALWLRWVVPVAVLAVGGWWLASDVLGLVSL